MILPNQAFAQSTENAVPDKLIDSNGSFILNTLPYNETFLEPSMDAETLHLHHQFHHGGAVKAANLGYKFH